MSEVRKKDKYKCTWCWMEVFDTWIWFEPFIHNIDDIDNPNWPLKTCWEMKKLYFCYCDKLCKEYQYFRGNFYWEQMVDYIKIKTGVDIDFKDIKLFENEEQFLIHKNK